MSASTSNHLRYATRHTDIGHVLVAQNDRDELLAVLLGDTEHQVTEDLRVRHRTALLFPEMTASLSDTLERLNGYALDPYVRLPVPQRIVGTDFQRDVWRLIRQVPVGETTSYTALASEIGNAASVRAVAQACAANPLALITPCHRVLKNDGDISGYQWGDERKRRLLDLEKKARSNARSDRPGSSVFARGDSSVHVVPMSVIRRPMPSELEEAKVEQFMEQMRHGDIFTPIEIVKVRAKLKADPTGPLHNFYFSLGGCHRYEATKRLGLDTIRARIIEAPASQLRVYLGAGSPF